MKKVKILCDSVCDILSYDFNDGLKIFDIDYLPLYVHFDREIYKDWKEIDTKTLFEKVKEYKQTPKTTCPSPDDYKQLFEKYLVQDYDIVFFSIGSLMSGGYRSALIAKEELGKDNVFVIDSGNISSGIGIQIVHACKLRDEGKSAEEIATILDSETGKVKCKFVADTMEYLHKGGRCSGLTALIGSLLRIKPVITVSEGQLKVFKVCLGKKKGLSELLNNFFEDYNNGLINLFTVFITYTVGAEEEAKYLRSKLVEGGIDNSLIHDTYANCTVGAHCGPATIGIIYKLK